MMRRRSFALDALTLLLLGAIALVMLVMIGHAGAERRRFQMQRR